jgi:tetratricopeptide (TPR) repeat protein/predicted Ser/Thr protein kinase
MAEPPSGRNSSNPDKESATESLSDARTLLGKEGGTEPPDAARTLPLKSGERPPDDAAAVTHFARPPTPKDRPAGTPSSQTPSQPLDESLMLERGARVERYLIIKPVGHGGLGVVYAAYDPELDRKIALKLLRADSAGPNAPMAEEGRLREAQAMARVTHPNVITVHDVGRSGEQVFIAMEFIQGRNLHDWIRLERQATPRQVLRLFHQAGQGLIAAHRAGLVHRDFKPTNVLIGDNGRVCVTDIGLARLPPVDTRKGPELLAALETIPDKGHSRLVESLTETGLVTGTPQYMPPEQYLGSVDARADQFSFCAALYWALYRKHAFEPKQMVDAALTASVRKHEGPGPAEPWRRLPHGSAIKGLPMEPPLPYRVQRALMRGLSLHPDDRFPSMEALLEELSWGRQRANRRGALAAMGLMAVAAASTGLYLYRQSQVCAGAEPLIASVWGPAARQKLEVTFAATGKSFAAESARGVERQLDAYASRWSRLHTEACEATRVRAEQTEELLSLRVVCMEQRRKSLAALVGLLTEADSKLVERSVDAAAALPELEACQDIESLTGQTPLPANPGRRATIEKLGEQLAQVKALLDVGRYPQGLELARKLEPQVESTTYRPLQAELRYHLAWLLHQQGQVEDSFRQFERALADAEAGRSDRRRLEVLTRLIYAYANNGHPEEARRWGGIAQGVLERVGGDPPQSFDLTLNLGYVALLGGRYQEAWDTFSRAQALESALPPEDIRRAKVSHALGLAALRLEKLPKAIELLGQSLQRTSELKGPHHPEVAIRHSMLATAYRESGAADQALEHARTALEVRQAALGPEHPSVADDLDELGECLLLAKRYEEALKSFRDAEALKRKVLGPAHPALSYSLEGVGKVLLAQGRAAEALEPLRQVLSYENTAPELLAQTGFTLAQALWEVGMEPVQALEQARRAQERYTALGKQRQALEIKAWLEARIQPP